MNRNFRKISPIALGVALFCGQGLQPSLVMAASLGDSPVNLGELAPSIPTDPSIPGETKAGALGGCPTDALKINSSSPSANPAGAVPGTTSSLPPSSLAYQSASVPAPAISSSSAAGSTLIAQLIPDENCCEFGGTADCELGGVPPVGGAAIAGFPFAALAGLLPLAAIPFIGGGGDNGGDVTPPPPPPPPVPESSSTGAIVAGVGLFGLWFSRRFRSGQSPTV